MSNHMGLVWVTVAGLAAVTAVGVGLNGYRGTTAAQARPTRESGSAQDTDPLAPRLFDTGGAVRVHVAGAVRKPGVYTLPAWARVVDAMKKAGGATANADLDAINLADRLRDGEQVRIPVKGRPEPLRVHRPAPEPPAVPASAGGHASGRTPFATPSPGKSGASALTGPVDLNTATREELDALPGVGPATADKILAYRQEHGPFLQPEDLMNVKGIGPVKFERMRPLVMVAGG